MCYFPNGKLFKYDVYNVMKCFRIEEPVVSRSMKIFLSALVSLCIFPVFAYGETVNPHNKDLLISAESLANGNDLVANKTDVPAMKLQGEVTQEQIPAPESKLKIWSRKDNATGNWFGYRDKLQEKGITFKAVYVDDFFQKLHGGNSKKNPLEYNGFIKSSVEFDTKKLGLWSGGKAHITFPHKFGSGMTANFLQSEAPYSNIYTKPFVSLGEFWYEQSLLSDTFKIKIGKQDLESEYAVLSDSYNFINGGLSENPTIPLPAITRTAIGVTTTIAPIKAIKLRAGIFDGNAKRERLGFGTLFSGSYFDILEGEANYSIKKHPGTTKIGYWYRSGRIDEISSDSDVHQFQSNFGTYAAVKQMLFKENENKNDTQGLYTHALFGWRPSDRNELSGFYGLGLQYKGLFPKRDDDIVGVGSEFVKLSHRTDCIEGRSNETSIESFYRIQLTKSLAIQPDFQVIFKPNGNGKTAWLLGIRSFISF